MSLNEYRDYLEREHALGAVIYCTFLHHTWSPDSTTFKGMSTMRAIERAQMIAHGAREIMCNVYCAPDRTVYTGRSPREDNCACQAPPRDFRREELPERLRELMAKKPGKYGGSKWRRWPNAYGFSVETIGNFDREDPTTSTSMTTSLDVLAMVHEIWDIPVEYCFFHRDVSYKTCPGSRVSRDWVHSELRRRLDKVDVSGWAEEAVSWAKETGLMRGYPDGTFKGKQAITREEVAVILRRFYDMIRGKDEKEG